MKSNKTRDWVNAEKITINVFGENFNEKEVMKTRKKVYSVGDFVVAHKDLAILMNRNRKYKFVWRIVER